MKAIFLDWNSFGNEDMIAAMEKLNIEVKRLSFDKSTPRREPMTESMLENAFLKEKADFVFSFNYFPIVSTVCNKIDLTYVSWVYDSPHVTLYSYTIIQPCNRVFVFDRAEYLKFHNQGINTVHYLPLAANPDRIDALLKSKETDFKSDISFIGSLYSEKHNVLANLKPAADGVETAEWLKTEYVDNRELTSCDRISLINKACLHGDTCLFTGSDTSVINPRVKKLGRVDYYDEAPFIYKNSRINLCPTLRSIHTGIPLRVFDILASGGLLLMNHQSDMDEFFAPGEDYYLYEDPDDFERKLDYILSKDNSGMCRNALEKIRELHTYEVRVREMLKYL